MKTYSGVKAKEISFPIGGIGSGCIGLAGNGQLIDWEIFNRPSKGSVNGFSHFAVKAEQDGKVMDARVLQGDLQPSYVGALHKPMFSSYGFGPARESMAGVPHFQNVTFSGIYPFANLHFEDPCFPGNACLCAWNPLIPLNEDDSSLPAAFFEISLTNTTDKPIDYTIAFSVANPLTRGSLSNTTEVVSGIRTMHLKSDDNDLSHPQYGNLCVSTDAKDTGFQNSWFRGKWFDSLGVFWRDFTSPGKLHQRTYSPDASIRSEMCTLSAHLQLNPDESDSVRFVLSWNFPNNTNYWNPLKEDETLSEKDKQTDTSNSSELSDCHCESGCCTKPDSLGVWKNWYATKFKNAAETAAYAMKNWNRLYQQTRQFHNTLASSTLSAAVIEAVSANISILKSPTCLRLEDGSFYGWEGCGCDSGCCEGSCTHVWNYAYALPFLFPNLERSMRDLDFRYNMREDGGMVFRLQLPLGRKKGSFRPCADGQFGGVIKAYREWKISGDTEWLQGHWDAIKKNIQFAWSDSNDDKWDADKDGILEGRQHHTLDMELFGPNSWLTGMYLGALKAASKMADALGDTVAEIEFRELFQKGKAWADQNLFNGSYYMQKVDLKDQSLLEKYNKGNSLFGDTTMEAYWNSEAEEIKYQIGEGCAIDQVLAQWHANLMGLGEIFDSGQVKTSLQSIYQHNYKRSFRNFFNPCRLYSLNDEGGVVICDWPEGAYKPVVPAPYCEETMYGFEYQAAVHMIQEGMVSEGLEIIEVIRSRFDGEKRNPWNEFECGNNYARSMASYALLNALSGFTFDMTEKSMGFVPVVKRDLDEPFRCFWSLNTAWGSFSQTEKEIKLNVIYGYITLKSFTFGKNLTAVSVEMMNQDTKNITPIVNSFSGGEIVFTEPLTINSGETLVVGIS